MTLKFLEQENFFFFYRLTDGKSKVLPELPRSHIRLHVSVLGVLLLVCGSVTLVKSIVIEAGHAHEAQIIRCIHFQGYTKHASLSTPHHVVVSISSTNINLILSRESNGPIPILLDLGKNKIKNRLPWAASFNTYKNRNVEMYHQQVCKNLIM